MYPCSTHLEIFTHLCNVLLSRSNFLQLDPEAEDLIRGFLVWEPAQRLGSAGIHQIKQHPFFASVSWSRMESEIQRDQQLYVEMAAQQEQRPEQQEQPQTFYGR